MFDNYMILLYYTAMNKTFVPYNTDQQFLLPPSVHDWLSEGHLAIFIYDIVESLDLSALVKAYGDGRTGGRPPFPPQMITKLIVYAYATGNPSSRSIERATFDDLAYRFLAANLHPDHDSIASFRKQHLAALGQIFLQTRAIAKKAGLVKLGHMSLDGTKVKANASKHKAMSYGRMDETMARLEQEIKDLLAKAEEVAAQADAELGKGNRGDDLPKEINGRQQRIAKIAAAKSELEQEARAKAEAEAAEVTARLAERGKGS